MREVIPEAVVERPDGYRELNVDPIHWAVVNAVQELGRENMQLRADIIGTTFPAAKLEVAGSIKSSMWNVKQVVNAQAGGLPIPSTSFTSGGGTLMIFASGSEFSASAGAQIGMSIAVDGVIKGYAKSYSNEANSQKAFTANAVVVTGIAAGTHTVTLSSWNGTTTDLNDFFSVTVVEFPF